MASIHPIARSQKSSLLAPSNAGQIEYYAAAAAIVHRSQKVHSERSPGLQPAASHIDRIQGARHDYNALPRSRMSCLISSWVNHENRVFLLVGITGAFICAEEMLAREILEFPRSFATSIPAFFGG
jgi:hypothetical protein